MTITVWHRLSRIGGQWYDRTFYGANAVNDANAYYREWLANDRDVYMVRHVWERQ